MLYFYYVNKEYANFLRQYDEKVPNLNYDSHDKFFCGVVFEINGFKYYAPISHETVKQQTSLIIYDKGRAISSIKFAFMIPVLDEHLTKIDFEVIAKDDPKYADLLRAEYRYCSSIAEKLYDKAKSVYNIGPNKSHRLNFVCCQFKELEKHVNDY